MLVNRRNAAGLHILVHYQYKAVSRTCMWKIMYAHPARYKTYHAECNEA